MSMTEIIEKAKQRKKATKPVVKPTDLYTILVTYGKQVTKISQASQRARKAKQEYNDIRLSAYNAGTALTAQNKKMVELAKTKCKTDKGYSIQPIKDELAKSNQWPTDTHNGHLIGKDKLKKSSVPEHRAFGLAIQVLASTCSRLNKQDKQDKQPASKPAASQQPASKPAASQQPASKPAASQQPASKPAKEKTADPLSEIELLTVLQAMEIKDLQSLLNKLAADEKARTAMETAVSIAKLKSLSN